ncbi:TetR family transcriptional regulator [Arthrobacter sp. Cr_A7]|uniref:TetR/AcrR family transcriptional regulator n=1 Tax=Arthrobacter sp. Cr_A7 TaxID=3031017 RepID=UPI0023DAC13B|nr:TetR family transcriptional regulator [Arthrobacter sp. Cr_A7]MDF2049576.1 TetR family transcriptional regulator [Arthrobacter sp. Cr_A7]
MRGTTGSDVIEHPGAAADDVPTRQRIIEATVRLIVQEGVRSLSHRRVARSAGVAPGAPYYYFKTIDDLLVHAFEEAFEREEPGLAAALQAIAAGEDVATTLATFLHARLADREYLVLLNEFWVVALADERLRPLGRAWGQRLQQELSQYLDDESAAIMAVSLIGGLAQWATVADPPMTVEQLARVLRRGLVGPTSSSVCGVPD